MQLIYLRKLEYDTEEILTVAEILKGFADERDALAPVGWGGHDLTDNSHCFISTGLGDFSDFFVVDVEDDRETCFFGAEHGVCE